MFLSKELIIFYLQLSIAIISCEDNTLETKEMCHTSKINAAAMSLMDESNYLLFSGSKYWEMGTDGKLIRVNNIHDTWPEIDSVDGACSVSKGFTGNPQYIFIKDSFVYIYDVDKDSKKSSLEDSGNINEKKNPLSVTYPESKKFYCFSCFEEDGDLIITAMEQKEGVAYKCTYSKMKKSKVECTKDESHPIFPGDTNPSEWAGWPKGKKCAAIALNTEDLSALKAVYIDDSKIYNFESQRLASSYDISSTFNCLSISSNTTIIAAAVVGTFILLSAVVIIIIIKKRAAAEKESIPKAKSHFAGTKSQIITIDSNTGQRIKHK